MVTSIAHDVLAETLFGKTRRSILSLLYMHADEQFYLRRIVRETGIGLGPAQRELKLLTDAGIIERQDKDRLVYYQANRHCPVYGDLKNIMLKTAGLVDIIHFSLAPVSDRVKAAFIYGSFASGKENRQSDVDLMVIGPATFAQISQALSPAQEKLQREINFAVYEVGEFRKRAKEKDHFIKSMIGGPKIFVTGSADELARLVE